MRRRGAVLPRRPAAEWAGRLGLAVLALGAGTWSVMQSLGYTNRGVAPELAHRLAPRDGRITALLSEQMSRPEAKSAERAEADRTAQLALLQDPTAVPALATLGIDTQLRGDTAGARRLFTYAQKLSRRDLRTQLWAIEDAVSRGDVPGTLHQYDTTLRTILFGPDLLFPVLGTAIADPGIRTALTKVLLAKPEWGGVFIEYIPANGPDSHAVFELFEGLRRAGVPISSSASTALINALLKSHRYDEAWPYYASVRPGADRRRSRDPHFAAALDAPSPLDWMTVEDMGLSASIQRGEKGGVFDFSAPASVGGTLLRQMQLLPAGDYILQGHSQNIDHANAAGPYWALTCEDGRELGRVEIPNSSQSNGKFAGRFAVSSGCSVQFLSLVARPSETMGGTSGQIDFVQLAPAG